MTENNASKKKSFEERAASKPTALHEAFAKWIEIETGYKPDLKTVQLAVSLRMDFQASPENQASLAARKAEAASKAEAAKARKLAKLEAELAKLKGEEVKPAEAAPAVEESKVEEYDSEADQALSDDAEKVAEAVGEVDTEPYEADPNPEPVEEAKPVAKPRVRRTRRSTTTK